LFVATLLLRLPRWTTLGFAAVGAASTALYFHGFTPSPDAVGPSAMFHASLALLRYAAIYLGSAWVTHSATAAVLLGSVGLVVAAILLMRSARSLLTLPPLTLQMEFTVLFCVATALLTALGRLSLGFEQAFASRYQTVVLLFWWALGVLLLQPLLERALHGQTVLAQLLLLAIVARGALLWREPFHEARIRQFALDWASASLVMDVNDPEVLQLVYPRPSAVWEASSYLRAQHWSIFSQGIVPGMSWKSFYPVVPSSECAGAVESATALDRAYPEVIKISGWSWDRKHGRPPAAVFATDDGALTGWAAVGSWRPTVRASHPEIRNSFVGFAGYLRAGPTAATLYAVSADGSACAFAEVPQNSEAIALSALQKSDELPVLSSLPLPPRRQAWPAVRSRDVYRTGRE
jgi:hypothetical protein